jgi:hypothetical protein
VFNRLNGKRYHTAASQKEDTTSEGFTPAHEENVRFVYEGETHWLLDRWDIFLMHRAMDTHSHGIRNIVDSQICNLKVIIEPIVSHFMHTHSSLHQLNGRPLYLTDMLTSSTDSVLTQGYIWHTATIHTTSNVDLGENHCIQGLDYPMHEENRH